MSQKKQLQTHIDGLCEELGITDQPYKSDTTIAQLQSIIDTLEDQLPSEDQEEAESADDSEGLTVEEQPDLQYQPEPDTDIPSGSEVSVMDESDIPEGAIVEDKSVKVSSDEKGDLEVKAKTTIYLMSHGKSVKISKGKTAFIEEFAALQALDEGVAVLLAE